MNDAHDVDELLGLVNRVGPTPADFRERLRGELAATFRDVPSAPTTDRETSDIDLVAQERRPTTGRRWGYLAVAAAAVILALTAVLVRRPGDQAPADVPSTITTPGTLVPVIADPVSACERFVATSPSRDDLTGAIERTDGTAVDLLDELVAALDVLIRDVEWSDDVAADVVDRLRRARSFYFTAMLESRDGGDARSPFLLGENEIGFVAAEAPSLAGCRDY